jgi:hypothetical protein
VHQGRAFPVEARPFSFARNGTAKPESRKPIATAGKPEAQAEGIRVASPETTPHSLGSRLGLQRTGPPNPKTGNPLPLPGSPKRKLREYASLHRKPLPIPSARASGFKERDRQTRKPETHCRAHQAGWRNCGARFASYALFIFPRHQKERGEVCRPLSVKRSGFPHLTVRASQQPGTTVGDRRYRKRRARRSETAARVGAGPSNNRLTR